MKGTVTLITLCDLLFILLLAISGSMRGVGSDIIYYLAFIAPVLIALATSRERGHRLSLGIKKGDVLPFICSVPVAISLIVLFVYLTTLIMGALGFENTKVIEGPLPMALLMHALIPSVLEETLFRYMPIRLMGDKSPRVTVLISALLFSLCHTNLFQILYAFVGGVILCYVDLATGSILPSLIIHFLNNTLSVITMLYPALTLPVFITVGVLALVCALLITLRRRVFVKYLSPLTAGDDEAFGYAPIALAAVSLFIAISNLVLI